VRLDPGTRAFVTGASRGIGRALAEALAARGAIVGLAARSADELEALATALPGEHQVLPCDVSDRDDMGTAIDVFADRVGGLDLVIANAGVTYYEPFLAQAPAHIRRMVDVNLLGTLWTVQAALPHLVRAGRGHVVVVSSGAGLRAFPSAAVYGATKAAQRGFADALRHELAGTGVSLTTVFPGEIASSLHDHERDTMPAWYSGETRPASELATRVLEGIEADRRAVHHPREVGLLGVLHGISPRLADTLLRRLRGVSAAPRRD
jgi:NADP-dependent 3-hydroxy acid dehydrogenase YdfG